MLPPNEYADQIFDVLRFSIDLACTEQHWSTVSRDALAFGFTQRDVSTAFAYAQRFDLFIAPPHSLVSITAHSTPLGRSAPCQGSVSLN